MRRVDWYIRLWDMKCSPCDLYVDMWQHEASLYTHTPSSGFNLKIITPCCEINSLFYFILLVIFNNNNQKLIHTIKLIYDVIALFGLIIKRIDRFLYLLNSL